MYIRGHARDYDRWAQMGCRGWTYAEILPYFKRAERHELGGDAYHGGDGPLTVAVGQMSNPLCRAFVEAGEQAGYARTDDVNGYQQEGFGRNDRTTSPDGKRALSHGHCTTPCHASARPRSGCAGFSSTMGWAQPIIWRLARE